MMKIVTYSYLIFLSFIFLIPIDSKIVTTIIDTDNHPSDFTSLFIHLFLLFFLYFLFKKIYFNFQYLIFFGIFYSILIEYLQIFTGRGFEIYDLIFNLLGIIICNFFFLIFVKNDR